MSTEITDARTFTNVGMSELRTVLSLTSGGVGFTINGAPSPPIRPGERARITAFPFSSHVPFRSERLLIGSRNSMDWTLDDVLVDGVSQIKGPIRTADLESTDDRYGEHFDRSPAARIWHAKGIADVTKEITVLVTYVGDNPDGEHFQASMIGAVVKNAA